MESPEIVEDKPVCPFAILWGGQAVSFFGTRIVRFALVWWITDITWFDGMHLDNSSHVSDITVEVGKNIICAIDMNERPIPYVHRFSKSPKSPYMS